MANPRGAGSPGALPSGTWVPRAMSVLAGSSHDMDRALLLSESPRALSDGGTAHLKASEDAGAASVSRGGTSFFRVPGGGHPSEALSLLQPRGAEGMASSCIQGRQGAPASDLEPRSPKKSDSGGTAGEGGFTPTRTRPGRGFMESKASWALKRRL